MKRPFALAACLLTYAPITTGGSAQDPVPAFDVASVKVNKSRETGARLHPQPDGGLTAVNTSLRYLIEFAYQIRPFQLEQAPDWAGNTRYDIIAKGDGDNSPTPPGAGPPRLVLMLRSLLADRFKLKVHSETRQLPIFALTLVRADGKLGPQLTPSTADCQALMNAASASNGTPPAPRDRMRCGLQIGMRRLSAGAVPISEFANALSWLLQRTVADRTGLTGNFDVDMTFRPEQFPALNLPPGAAQPSADPDSPSIFNAVQEQLGLRLESTRGPMQVVIVDHVESAAVD